jgi:hypothetical protein
MQTPLAQIVALTCYGNAVLRGVTVPRFFPDNSTCQFCEFVNFISLTNSTDSAVKETVTFHSPDEWLADLLTRGVSGIRLRHKKRNDPNISDRMSSGFVGGGRIWTIESLNADATSDFWTDRWTVGNRQALERKIWHVSYGKILSSKTMQQRLRPLSEIKTDIQCTLNGIRSFSEKQNLNGFSTLFINALRAIEDHRADVGYHKDLFPIGTLTDNAESLLKAAMSAWVFGGMGSWNDMGFEGDIQTEYTELSDKLYSILIEAIAAAATSSMFNN